jgi:predicted transcriptional regulator
MTEDSRLTAALRRSRMEVRIDILQAIADGAGRPTHIMYRSNLSWSIMQSFVRVLEQQGLISRMDREGKKNYVLTEKGQRVLQTYLSVRQQLENPVPIAVVARSVQKSQSL